MDLIKRDLVERTRSDVHSISASVGGELIYCIGDIHGCYGLLTRLLSQIVQDISRRARERRAILVFCGDYIDRGPDSFKVVAALTWLQRHADFETHFLMGNHERALLDYLNDPEQACAWLRYGGYDTLRSYGVRPPSQDGKPMENTRARDDLLDMAPASHLQFLNNLELLIGIGDVAFVHAGVKPRTPLNKQDPDDLLWIRHEFLDWSGGFEKLIVHGHTWHDDQVELLEHRICVDTGAYETGTLSAIRLEDGEVEVIRASMNGAHAPSHRSVRE